MIRIWQKPAMILALWAVGLFQTGCSTGDSQIRFVHASPDASNLDVFLDGKHVVGNLAFANASGYFRLSFGDHRIEVRAVGTSRDLINSKISFTSDRLYTLLAAGLVAGIAAAILTDSSTAQNGNARLRVLNHTRNASSMLDVHLVNPGSNIAGVSPRLSSLEFQHVSRYEEISPASSEVIVTASGSKVPGF